MLSPPPRDNPILLVDDEQDIRDVLQVALADAGYDVLQAENGRQALDLFLEKRPPIVVTDIKMPVLDGIQLLRRIKREAPDTEVIMITGHGDMDLAVRSLKHEASDFITKPIHVDALEIALKRVGEKILMRRKLQEYTTNLERLLKEKSELQDHLSSLGLMIGSISHGIKSLLTGLDGGMYLLESGLAGQDQTKIAEGWETVKVMVERVRKMVLDILFYAKKRDLQWEQVDVTRFAREMARMVAVKVEKLPINLICDIEATAGVCTIDPGYVHSALLNIFENAIDACQRRDDCPRHDLHFCVRTQDDTITFSVSDTGIGMDRQTLSKLFTVFFSSKGRKGTGLGLFIANKIVAQHGGCIEVSSTPGQGSCFTVTIPKRRQAPPEQSPVS
jgi:signal transduction histidine kinase